MQTVYKENEWGKVSKRIVTGGISKVPRNTLAGQLGKRNHNVGIIRNEAVVKISEAKKRLNFFNLAGLRPILNSLNLGGIHLQSVFREDEAEVFNSVFRKMTFIQMGI